MAPQLWYVCQVCRTPLTFSNVLEMSKIEDEKFDLYYSCVCMPKHVISQKFMFNADALRSLLVGFRPALPYRAADLKEPYPLTNDDERAVRVFGWECGRLASVAEFELFATRPAADQGA